MSIPEVGTVVEAHGLQNFPMLNGVQGKVIRLQSTDKGVLPLVEFPAPHGKLMLKPTNFRIISAPQPQAQPSSPQSERQVIVARHPIGAEIEATGLKTQHHLNGLKGRIEAHHDSPDGSVKIVVDFGPPHGLIGLRPVNIKTLNTSSQQLPTVGRTASSSVSPVATRPGSNSVSPSNPGRKSVTSVTGSSPRQSLAPRTPSGSVAPSAPSVASRRPSTMSDVSRTSSKKTKREVSTTFTPPSGLVTYQERYSTFASWPSHLQSAQVNPKELAFAGFYHNPSQKDPDKCTCFTCGYSLVQWSPGDVPWNEHSKHVPSCAFVVAHKASLKASAALKKMGKGRELPALEEEGYLKKRKPGKLASGWDDRYFALRGAMLYYYEEKAVIDLSRGCECSAVPHDSCSFTVNAVGQKRDAFVLKAANDTERDQWVEALNGSKQRGMSKEDVEVLGGFETAEAEVRTQLVFDAANETTMLAGACIVNSLRISAVISCEFKERVVRCELLLEEEQESNRIHRAFEQRKTKLRLSEHLRRMIYQDEKRVAYNTWRLAAAPKSTNAGNEVEIEEAGARRAIPVMEAYERNELLTHLLNLTCVDLNKATKDATSLRNELQTVRSTPAAPEIPPKGTKIFIHGLKNMAALNGEEARVTDGQTLPDGTNAVLVELLNKPDSAPMFLKLQNIYTPPSDELIEMIKKPTVTKLDEALAKVTELEASLAKATQQLSELNAESEHPQTPPEPTIKEVAVPDPEVAKELEKSKERMASLELELADLMAQLDTEKRRGKDVTTLDEGPLLTNPQVVYSPVPTVGSKVVAHGLKSMESLNGLIGEVTEIQTLPDGTTVPLVAFPEPNQTVMVRKENLTPVPSQYVLDSIIGDVCKPQLDHIAKLELQLAALQQQLDAKPAPTATLPAIGDKVIAHGLRNNNHLNGQDGSVLEHQKLPDSTPAVVVKFENETLMLRLTNCSPIPVPEVCNYVNKQLNAEVASLKAKIAELKSELIVAQNQIVSQAALAKAGVPGVGERVIARGLNNSEKLNSCQGIVLEHSTAPDGSIAAVVKFDDLEHTMMLKGANLATYPPPEVVECVIKEERAARQAAEAALEMERANHAAMQKETESKLPEKQSLVVPYNLPAALAELNGKLATVTDHQSLGDGTAVLDVDIGGTVVMVKAESVVKMPQDAYDQILEIAKQADTSLALNMQGKLKELEARHKALEADVAARDLRIQTQSEEHSAADAKSEDDIAALRGEIADMETKLQSLEKENSELKNAEVSAEQMEALQNEKSDLCTKINDLEKERDELSASIGSLQEAIDKLKAENAEFVKQIKHLHDEDLIGGLSKQLMDTQYQCNELTGRLVQAEEARAAAEAAIASRNIRPQPGDEVMLKVVNGDEAPLRGKVIKMDGANAACVKFEHDMTPSVGSIISLTDIVVVPPPEVVALLTNTLTARNQALESRLVIDERRIKELEDKLVRLEEEQGKTLEQNKNKLQSMLSTAALQTDKCEFCVELQAAVNELLKKTEEERAAQRVRQERMLQAIEEEAAKRSEEEARLYEMINDLQRKAERARYEQPIAAPKMFPDTELHQLFEEMKKDAEMKNAVFTTREAELLAMVDEAVREGNNPSELMSALDELRKQTLQARKAQAEKETAVLQAIQQRREGEASLVSDMRNRGLAQSQQFLHGEQKMLDVVQVRDDQTAEYQATIKDLRAKIEAQAHKEKELLESLEKMKARVGLDSTRGGIAPSDVDVLLETVSDPKLRAVLEGLRREGARQQDADLLALIEQLQLKAVEHDENEALLNKEINDLKRKLNMPEGADKWIPASTPLSYSSPQRSITASPAYSLSPAREHDPASDIAALRKQLSDTRNSMSSLQAEYNQTSEALASSSSRVNILQSQTESMQHLVEARQADIDNLTYMIKKVQQLPVLQDNARKMLQDIVPLDEVCMCVFCSKYQQRPKKSAGYSTTTTGTATGGGARRRLPL
eukprot:TRINITY_DN4200_c0_g1_i4.p1 TRINITY_DN4200_c0_g1~~TRINITY_DN4200_c0_g1_i4.p1  ORF type:complete len:1972 (+),score=601.31 TRINITY_DN4200_c0_g1_i4:207-6122(+)